MSHEQGIEPDVVEPAGRVFDLARGGYTEALAAAVFKQSAETVRALPAAGADPDAGGPTARQTAAFFDLPQ